MLSLWPSFSLLLFFLVIFLECRAIGGRVTLPLGSFLMVFCYGAIGAPLLALLFQQIPYFPDAGVDAASPIGWLIGPPVEELAKALPVIVLAFLTRESRRLSIADLTLIGFASGAGFGFVEGNLNALVTGTLPSVQHIGAFGLQTQAGLIFFAGHPVSSALVGLAAGIGLRFLPPNFAYAWAPSVGVILWASFDHGLYNWKLLHAVNAGVPPEAHVVVEFLHLLTLNGQLQTWLLPIGLIAAQFFEAHLCAKAMGARRDLMLAREWRPWVINEWLVALMRAPLGRAAFAQTWGYFRLRRAFYLATFEARRDPKDVMLSRHAHSLEDRLKRERSILFDPPRGTWLLPVPVLKSYAAQWLWRMRWVLVFTILLLFLFLLDPASLPEWLRQFLFGDIFASSVVVAGLAFAVWRIILFARLPPPDPLAAEGAACAGYYTRAMLLGSALVCGLFPTLAVLLGWKAFAPGAAFISGYLPGWIAQGGNLQALLGLGAIGAAVAPDPRPAGEALRHEIAAADDRMRRLGSEIAQKIGAPDGGALTGTAPPIQLDAFLNRMATLDAERDAQARRRIALDECARQAAESTIKDPTLAVQAVKDEFDRLAAELLDSAAKELDSIAAFEQTYGRAWIEIMQDLDAHDTLRRRLRTPLRVAWQAQNEIDWALRVVEATDDCLLPMQLTLLPELDALATTARSERAKIVAAGIERIRAAADHYGAGDPFDFAVGTNPADEDEAALLAEFACAAPVAAAPKSFGLRTPQASEEAVDPAGDESASVSESDAPPAASRPRAQRYQKALDRLIDTSERDQAYLDTIRHLERSDESAETRIEPAAPEADAVQNSATFEIDRYSAQQAEAAPTVAPSQEPTGEVEDLIDAIKRDSGYLAFKEPKAGDDREQAQSEEDKATATPAQSEQDAVAEHKDAGPEIRSETAAESQALAITGYTEAAVSVDDAPVLPQEQVADEISDLGEDTADVGETETAPVAQEPGAVEPVDLAPAADEAPGSEIVRAAESTSAFVESDVLVVAEAAGPETDVSDTAEHTNLTEPNAGDPGDVQADEPDAVSTAPQISDEPAHEPVIGDLYLDDIATLTIEEPASPRDDVAARTASPDFTDLVILDFEPSSVPDETPREDNTRAKTIEHPKAVDTVTTTQRVTQPAEDEQPIEPYRPAETEAPRAPEEPPARIEIRSSLFAKLFQSLRHPSPTVRPHIADQPAPDVSPSKPEPAAPWLVDLASAEPNSEAPNQGELSLEPIEWPAAKTPTEDHASAPDGAIAVDVADQAETDAVNAPDASTDAAPSDASQRVESASTNAEPDKTGYVDSTETAEPTIEVATESGSKGVGSIDAQKVDVVLDSARSAPIAAVAEEEPQPAADVTAAAPEAIDTAPQQVDEFSSKADRLSYLLAKLDGAIKAKAAAEAVSRNDAETGAREAEQSDAPAPNPEPQEVEVAVVADADSATPATPEPEAQTSAPVETAAPIVEAPAVETNADVVETPETAVEALASAIEPAASSSGTAAQEQTPEAPSTAVEPPREDRLEEAVPAPLKPDRLSYLLTKLFETAKRQPPEPPAKPQDIEPPPSLASTAVEEHADEILDLRLPETDHAEPVDVQEVEFGNLRDEAAEPPAAGEHHAHVEEPQAAHAAPIVEATDLPVIGVAASEPAPEPPARPRRAEPAPLFGTGRARRPRPVAPAPVPAPQADAKPTLDPAPVPAIELKPALPTAERATDASGSNTAATVPRRDWKLGAQGTRGDQPNAEDNETAAKKFEPTLRLKTGSGALATVDAPPPGTPVAPEKTPAKYYGPKHAQGEDDEAGAASPAQQRALSLADALAEFYAKAGQPQPPMHATDRATLQRIIVSGKLEPPRRRGAPWSISGMSRRGEVAIRLKPGAEQFIEFVPSTEIFGQVPHYYPRGVGKGSYVTHVPAGHLEYFDVATRQWAPVQRG